VAAPCRGCSGEAELAGPASVCDTHVGDGAMRGQPHLLVQVFEHGHEVQHTWKILVVRHAQSTCRCAGPAKSQPKARCGSKAVDEQPAQGSRPAGAGHPCGVFSKLLSSTWGKDMRPAMVLALCRRPGFDRRVLGREADGSNSRGQLTVSRKRDGGAIVSHWRQNDPWSGRTGNSSERTDHLNIWSPEDRTGPWSTPPSLRSGRDRPARSHLLEKRNT
jgi:hypothetical protein